MIVVSSVANLWAGLDVSDLNFERRFPGPYFTARPYARSKLCLAVFARELADREAGNGVKVTTHATYIGKAPVTAISLKAASAHPGLVSTGIFLGTPFFLRLFIRFLYLFGKTPLQGAQTVLHLATCGKDDFESGGYFTDCRLSRLRSSLLDDERVRKKLWDETARLVGLE